MITKNKFYLKMIFTACICAIILTGCGSKYTVEEKSLVENQKENQETLENGVNRTSMEKSMEFSDESTEKIPEIVEVDWSEYFNGLNGTAVIYDASNKKYTIYNRDLAITRSSPCSTFKIISSLIALENGIIETENSTKTWSGEIFWNEDWNKDIDFQEAFRTSCVWYFRQVIDDI